MNTFYGTDTYAIDDKGRLGIPAHVRRAVGKKSGSTLFLVAGFEGCLALYTEKQWAEVEQRLAQLPQGGRKVRAFMRALLMNATRVTVDAQGRISIPPTLRTRAGLGKEAVLLGQGVRLEIWNPDRLKAVLAEAEPHFEDLAEEVLG